MGELASGLTCSCLPTLRPLITHYAPWMSSHAGSYFRHTGGGKDVERGDTQRTNDSRGPPMRHCEGDWPLPEASTPDALPIALARVESSGETSDGVYGLRATREELQQPDPLIAPPPARVSLRSRGSGTSTPRRASFQGKAGSARRTSQESVRWMQPIVQTEITAPASRPSLSLPDSTIQVDRDIYQMEEPASV